MRKLFKKIPMFILVFVLAFGLAAVTASAAQKVPVKKLKNLQFGDKYAKVNKNASVVKKGNYIIKLGKTGKGYVKFKAPKTKAYTFTLSNLQTKNSYGSSLGYSYIRTIRKFYKTTYLLNTNFATQGGTYSTAWVGTYNGTTPTLKYRTLTSRYMKKKLKKGQTVFLYFSYYPADALTLNIK